MECIQGPTELRPEGTDNRSPMRPYVELKKEGLTDCGCMGMRHALMTPTYNHLVAIVAVAVAMAALAGCFSYGPDPRSEPFEAEGYIVTVRANGLDGPGTAYRFQASAWAPKDGPLSEAPGYECAVVTLEWRGQEATDLDQRIRDLQLGYQGNTSLVVAFQGSASSTRDSNRVLVEVSELMVVRDLIESDAFVKDWCGTSDPAETGQS